MALTRRGRRLLGWVLAVASVGAIVWTAVMDSGPDVDRTSYEKGYDVFRGSYLPISEEEDRESDRLYCAEFWGQQAPDDLVNVVKHDWVEGCADAREGEPRRFG